MPTKCTVKSNLIRPLFLTLPAHSECTRVNSDIELEFAGREVPANLAYVAGYHADPPKPLFEVCRSKVGRE
jgi:hypothetical protein